MGSTYHVRYVPHTHQDVNQRPTPIEVNVSIEKMLDAINAELSTWQTDSELTRFNSSRSLDWIEVSPSLPRLIKAAREMAETSGGKFDVTIAPLVNLWGFGPAGPIERRPSPQTVASALEHVGYKKVETREHPPALRKLDADVQVELSAMGAGEAADRIADWLLQTGFADFYVDVAGEIVTQGHRADGSLWQVGIQEPIVGSTGIMTTLELADDCIVTSGNYRHSIEIDGERFVHTLDATTGLPIQTETLSATVVERPCSRADGLATMFMTLPTEQAIKIADEQRLSVLLIVRREGRMALMPSTKFRERFPASE